MSHPTDKPEDVARIVAAGWTFIDDKWRHPVIRTVSTKAKYVIEDHMEGETK